MLLLGYSILYKEHKLSRANPQKNYSFRELVREFPVSEIDANVTCPLASRDQTWEPYIGCLGGGPVVFVRKNTFRVSVTTAATTTVDIKNPA